MGSVTRLPLPLLVAFGYFAVLAILFAIFPPAGGVLAIIGFVLGVPYVFVIKAKSNNRRFETARTDLAPGEEVRFWWKAGFLSLGERWVVVTTERLLIPQVSLMRIRTRSIPHSEIYRTDTSQRSIGVGAYGGGLLVGTTLSNRYLELDLVNGDVVRVRVDRPQTLQQRLNDAIAEWAQRQGA